MPASPRKCCGKKARLKPITDSQKWSLPSDSLYIFPVNFGIQK